MPRSRSYFQSRGNLLRHARRQPSEFSDARPTERRHRHLHGPWCVAAGLHRSQVVRPAVRRGTPRAPPVPSDPRSLAGPGFFRTARRAELNRSGGRARCVAPTRPRYLVAARRSARGELDRNSRPVALVRDVAPDTAMVGTGLRRHTRRLQRTQPVRGLGSHRWRVPECTVAGDRVSRIGVPTRLHHPHPGLRRVDPQHQAAEPADSGRAHRRPVRGDRGRGRGQPDPA